MYLNSTGLGNDQKVLGGWVTTRKPKLAANTVATIFESGLSYFSDW